MFCDDCAEPLTAEEIRYYVDEGHGRCESCERLWGDRMTAWLNGTSSEPELGSFFSARSPAK